MTDPPEDRPALARPFSVWIGPDEDLYLMCESRVGTLRLSPKGRKPLDLE